MSEKMKQFAMALGIELAQELDGNPFVDLSTEEVEKINEELKELSFISA